MLRYKEEWDTILRSQSGEDSDTDWNHEEFMNWLGQSAQGKEAQNARELWRNPEPGLPVGKNSHKQNWYHTSQAWENFGTWKDFKFSQVNWPK